MHPSVEVGSFLNQRYTLTVLLGEGRLGKLYQAEDKPSGQTVVVRVFPPEPASPAPAGRLPRLHRLQLAAQAATLLQHPHLQQLYFIGRDAAAGVDFSVAEYLPGGTLHQRLAAGPLTVSAALENFSTVCAAFEFVHRLGVVHKYLKTTNVMYAAADRLVVTDFDLADLGGEGHALPLDPTLRTLAYTPPEVLRGEAVDQRGDIYALGVLLFEMLTGQLPLKADEMKRAKRWGGLPVDLATGHYTNIVSKYLLHLPPGPREFNPAVPPAADGAVRRAMAKTPAERFQNAWELACAANDQPYTPMQIQPPPGLVETPQAEQATVLTARRAPTGGLRVVQGPQAGRRFEIGALALLGSSRKNDVCLEDQYASRTHAQIERQAGAYLLTDLKSANGTQVNGQPVEPNVPVRLAPGDQIEIGYTVLQFELTA